MTSGLDWDIDALVGAIMTDLRRNTSVSSADDVSKTLSRDFADVRKSSERPTKEPDVFDVVERVIVLDTVVKTSTTTDLKTWRVRDDAVITPSAYDELARRGLRLIRTGNSASGAAPSSATVRTTISASNPSRGAENVVRQNVETSKSTARTQTLLATCLPENEHAPRGVVDYLTRNTDVAQARLDCMKKTTELVAESIAANESLKVVIATHDGAVGCVWANRKKGVRAVVAVTVEQTKRDLSATNANTLIFDPRDLGPYQARQVVDFFVQMKRG